MKFSSQTIHLNTESSQMSFEIDESGKIICAYYGGKLASANDVELQLHSRFPAYPSSWDTKMTEAAISITQSDGHVSLDLVYESHKVTTPRKGQELAAFTLKDSFYPVKVIVSILAHEKTNVYEQWVDIINEGAEPVSVDQAASACLSLEAESYYVTSFRGTWAGESLLREEKIEKGNLLEAGSFSGTRTAQEGTPAFIISLNQVAQEETGEVYMGALAWSGNYRLRFKHNQGNYWSAPTLFSTFGADMLQSPYRLDGGKSLTLPRLILTHSNQGKGEASRQMHRWAREFGMRGGGLPRMTLLNSWEGAYFNFDEHLLHGMMERAAGIGVELFVLDDGWFANKYPRDHDKAGLGDWSINVNKLPNGLAGLIAEAEKQNIKFGIWVEPEMVNPKSELFENHPEWVIQLPHRPNRQERHQLVLDLTNPKVQDYIIGFMDTLLRENPGISYVKWDCNRTISNPGSTYLSRDHQKNLYIDYVKGYYSILERIITAHPGVTIQNCSSGGGRADYGAMKYHHEFWVSDNTDPYDRLYMQWGIGHIFPAISMASHVTESPNHQTKRSSPLKFRFDVAMSARLGFELQPGRLSKEDFEYCKTALAEYKRIRPVVQLGELYRLRSPYLSNDTSLMYVHADSKKQSAVVFAWLHQKLFADSPAPIQLRGLKHDKIYKINELNVDELGAVTSLDGKNASGGYLMNHGVKFDWKRTMQSCILELTEI